MEQQIFFGIYLLHPLLLAIFVKLPASFGLQNLGLFSVLLQFVGCVVGSALIMNLANRIMAERMYSVGSALG